MRKLLIVLLIVTMLTLVACGDTSTRDAVNGQDCSHCKCKEPTVEDDGDIDDIDAEPESIATWQHITANRSDVLDIMSDGTFVWHVRMDGFTRTNIFKDANEVFLYAKQVAMYLDNNNWIKVG